MPDLRCVPKPGVTARQLRLTPRANVLLVGGFATPRVALRRLSAYLSQRGHAVAEVSHRAGLDCSERSYRALYELAEVAVERARRPVHVVGFSRGGQFARVLAVRHPDLVSGLISLGTPNAPGLQQLNTLTRARIVALGCAGSAGIPGLVSLGCLRGGCCRQFWTDLVAPWPRQLPLAAVYAAHDRVVSWHQALEPAARVAVLPGGHASLLLGRHSHEAVADNLDAMLRGEEWLSERRLAPARNRRPARFPVPSAGWAT